MGPNGSVPCFMAQPVEQSQYMQFVKGFLRAAASLETSSEKPDDWNAAREPPGRWYGPRPRCDLDESVGPDSTTESIMVYTLLNQMWNHG